MQVPSVDPARCPIPERRARARSTRRTATLVVFLGLLVLQANRPTTADAAPEPARPLGRIYDQEVTLEDFRQELDRLRRHRGERLSAQGLRVRMITLATATREGVTVTAEAVQRQLESEVKQGLRNLAVNEAMAEEPVLIRRRKIAREAEARFNASWRFSPAEEARYLKAAELDAKVFRRWVREDLQIAAWLRKGRAELDGRALARLELSVERARVRVERVRIPARPDAVPFEPPRPEELEAHFKSLSGQLVQGRRVLASALLLPAGDAAAAAERWQQAAAVAPVASRLALLRRLFGARPDVTIAAPPLGPVQRLAGPDWLHHPEVVAALETTRPRRVSKPISIDDQRAVLVRVELARRAGIPTFTESRAQVVADWRELTALASQLGPAHDIRRRLNHSADEEPRVTPATFGLKTETLPEFSLATPPVGVDAALVQVLRRAPIDRWILNPALESRELWLVRVRSRAPLDTAGIDPSPKQIEVAIERALADRSFLALCRARGITEAMRVEARRLAPVRRLTLRRLALVGLPDTDRAAFLAGRLSLTRLARRAGVKAEAETVWPENALVARLERLSNREVATLEGPRGLELWAVADQPSPRNVRAIEVRRARVGPKPAGPHREGLAQSIEALARQDSDDPLTSVGGWIGRLQFESLPEEVELRRTIQGSEPGDRFVIARTGGVVLVEVLNALPTTVAELRNFDHRFERLLPFFQLPEPEKR